MILPISQTELKSVLMDPKSAQIKEPYLLINQGTDSENITIITPGKNGVEFNKTIGFTHKFNGMLIYKCIYGKGVLMMQKSDGLGEPKEVIVRGLRPGTEVEIPAGYTHMIANTGRTILVMVDNGLKDEKWKDRSLLIDKKGLAYYVIDKKGEIAFEKNPNYAYHPNITS